MWTQVFFFRFVAIHAFDRQTDGRTERPWQYHALHYKQSHGKNRSWATAAHTVCTNNAKQFYITICNGMHVKCCRFVTSNLESNLNFQSRLNSKYCSEIHYNENIMNIMKTK